LLCDNPCPAPFKDVGGPVHGSGSDGRIDITYVEAWPNRPVKEPALSAEEVAAACAAFGACADVSGYFNTGGEHVWRVQAQQACIRGALSPFSVNAAERAIPLSGGLGSGAGRPLNESWDYVIRAVLDAQDDCNRIQYLFTERDVTIECQEDGCYSTQPRTTTCEGEIATFQETGLWRDCSRSGMHCSVDSTTGCTDRELVRCEPNAADRCDGDIKLGCDHCGFVTFHDCAWNGGHCEEETRGARCVAPTDASACVPGSRCTGNTLALCIGGRPIDVDCSTIAGSTCLSLSESEASSLTADCNGASTDDTFGVISSAMSACTFAFCAL
jgi:hypothetical protein